MEALAPSTVRPAASVSSTRSRSVWTSAQTVALVALAAGGVLVGLDAWRDLVQIALRDEEQSHVFLVPVVAAWLFWVRRQRLRGYVPEGTWIGPVVIGLGWAMLRTGEAHLLDSVRHLGAILIVVGGVLSVAGAGLVVRFLPVFLSLAFLVPVPGMVRQAVALPLQDTTAQVTQSALELLGVTVERSGNLLIVNNQEVMISEACNGLRMVFALVMVCFAFAYGSPLRGWARVLVLVASPVTAIAFNVARLVPTVWAFGYLPAGVAHSLHDVGGWAMLPCAFVTLLGLMRLLRWAQIPISPYVLIHGE